MIKVANAFSSLESGSGENVLANVHLSEGGKTASGTADLLEFPDLFSYAHRRALGGYLRVGGRVVDLGGHRMADRTPAVRLTPKAVGVLLVLARHQGRTVTTDQLLDIVWSDTCPTPDVVRQAVRELRRTLGDSAKDPHLIETIARVGYRMVAECSWESRWPPQAEALSKGSPKIDSIELVRPAEPIRQSYWWKVLALVIVSTLMLLHSA